MATTMQPGESAPTMIIPRGTEIEVDSHGQLSIRAPGNLVIQNSGSYGNLESLSGSIRIDRDVKVEAVSVRCADACFVQGSLTAWKVTAKSLQLEDTARANIVLQETDRLEIGRDARLVGNFSSEKDLFLLFSRFARQVRSLPFYFERGGAPAELTGDTAGAEEPGPDDTAVRQAAIRVEATIERGRSGRAGGRSGQAAPAAAAGRPGRAAAGTRPPPRAAVLRPRPARTRRRPQELRLHLSARPRGGGQAARRARSRHPPPHLPDPVRRIVEPAEDTRRAADLVAGYFQRA